MQASFSAVMQTEISWGFFVWPFFWHLELTESRLLCQPPNLCISHWYCNSGTAGQIFFSRFHIRTQILGAHSETVLIGFINVVGVIYKETTNQILEQFNKIDSGWNRIIPIIWQKTEDLCLHDVITKKKQKTKRQFCQHRVYNHRSYKMKELECI